MPRRLRTCPREPIPTLRPRSSPSTTRPASISASMSDMGGATDPSILTTDTDGAPGGPFSALLAQANNAAAKTAGTHRRRPGRLQLAKWAAGRRSSKSTFPSPKFSQFKRFFRPCRRHRASCIATRQLEWLATVRGRIGFPCRPISFCSLQRAASAVREVRTNASLTTTVANNVPRLPYRKHRAFASAHPTGPPGSAGPSAPALSMRFRRTGP